ncbi:MAG: aldo/keto reductase [Lachnospiraceae bacterium]|nr:aldo/keto reductase [Lachnospiraceae bacterium]
MELCLGTVQFGMDYGICGQKKPSVEEACNILEYAVKNGISRIDTAKQYGTAEDVVGHFFQTREVNRDDIFLSTKFQPNRLDDVNAKDYYRVLKDEIQQQLRRLHTDYIDAYLLHSARYVFDDEILEALYRLKQEGYARYVGVSVYETTEAECGIRNKYVDYLQLPYSIFDQRMKNEKIFELAEERNNTIIDTRSAFIQGLILMTEDQVPEFLHRARPIIREINELSQKYHISKIALAMNFVKQTDSIHSLVFGVDNLGQLKEDIKFFEQEINIEIMKEIADKFKTIEADIVMPSLWKK